MPYFGARYISFWYDCASFCDLSKKHVGVNILLTAALFYGSLSCQKVERASKDSDSKDNRRGLESFSAISCETIASGVEGEPLLEAMVELETRIPKIIGGK